MSSKLEIDQKAILELRQAIRSSYGESVEIGLSDIEVEEIGAFLLFAMAEGLKMKVANAELLISTGK